MKKVKLFFTIASMCLSIAVFCFGVFSATQITYSIGGTISYEISDVFVKIQTKVFKNTKDTTVLSSSELKAKSSEIESDTSDNFDTIETSYGTATQSFVYDSVTDGDSGKAEGIKINYNDAKSWFIVIKVSSYISDKGTYFHLTEESLGSDANSTVYKSSTLGEIKKGASKNYVIALSLKDEKMGIENQAQFTYKFDLGLGDAPKDEISSGAKIEKLTDTTAKLVAYYGNGGEIDLTKTYSEETITTQGSFAQLKATFNSYSELESIANNLDNITDYSNATLEQLSILLFSKYYFCNVSYNNNGAMATVYVTPLTLGALDGVDLTNNQYYPLTIDHSNFTLTTSDMSDDECVTTFKEKLTALSNYQISYNVKIGSVEQTINSTTELNTLLSSLTSTPTSNIEISNVGKSSLGKEMNIEGGKLKITQIGVNAFNTLSNPAIVTIPNTITKIEDFGLTNCKKVVFADNSQISELGSFFAGQNGNSYVVSKEINEVDFGNNNWSSVPSSMFIACVYLKKVKLPETITIIKDYAFAFCERLVDINFPNALTEIQERAFIGCSTLVNINLSNSLKTIGNQAFLSCCLLRTIVLPKSLTSIGSQAFRDCDQLLQVRNLSGLEVASLSSLAEILTDEATQFSGTYEFTDKVVIYKDKNNVKYVVGLSNMEITRITADDIPDDVKYLYYHCYQDPMAAYWIMMIQMLSGSVLGIPTFGLEYVEVPNHVEFVGSPFYRADADDCYLHLTEIAFEKGCTFTTLPSMVGTSTLQKITIPKSVTQAEFSLCSSLQEVIFEDTTGWVFYQNDETQQTAVDVSDPTVIAEKIRNPGSQYIYFKKIG